MDAHVFRRFCDALIDLLQGARLEKIQSPSSDVHIFTFYAQQHKQVLVMRHDRRNPLIFISPHRHSNGQHPSAATMRLRKYAAGRRVKACVADWAARRLHLCFHAGPRPDEDPALQVQPETWISLDLRQGPLLHLGSPPDFGAEPCWPDAVQAALACAAVRNGVQPSALHSTAAHGEPSQATLRSSEDFSAAVASSAQTGQPWEQWPVLTPALRRTLPLLAAEEQAALLADLEYGGGDLFVYEAPPITTASTERSVTEDSPLNALLADASPDSLIVQPAPTGGLVAERALPEISAWPLPPALRGQRIERVYEDPFAALAPLGERMVLGGLARADRRAAASPHSREAKRLTRVLEKLEREECRLTSLVAGKEKALYLQSVLWQFPSDARPAALLTRLVAQAMAECAPAAACGAAAVPPCPPCPFDPRQLSPTLSLRENMDALFHAAARGARGLTMLEQRRALLRGQVSEAQHAAVLSSGLGSPPPGSKAKAPQTASGKGVQAKNLPAADTRILPKNVESFVSVDGLLILRGKDAKGNLAMLKLGAPADLWLHVAGGPGAHTLVRRTFAAQEVPQTTLEQAATLAAVKSWQKGSEKVEVQCAQVRHVKPMRGAATGTVRIDKIECMVRVTLPLQPLP